MGHPFFLIALKYLNTELEIVRLNQESLETSTIRQRLQMFKKNL